MAKDYEIALCMSCLSRPIDPDTEKPVEGSLRVAERSLGGCAFAAIVYSVVDPRVNKAFRLADGQNSTHAVRSADHCTPVANGLPAGLGDFNQRLRGAATQAAEVNVDCGVGEVLIRDATLPTDLLFQKAEPATNS
jgi:hypothetical protein